MVLNKLFKSDSSVPGSFLCVRCHLLLKKPHKDYKISVFKNKIFRDKY